MALTQDDLTARMNAPVATGPRMFTLHEQGQIGMELRELRDQRTGLENLLQAALDREAGLSDALDAMRRQSEEQAEEARKWRGLNRDLAHGGAAVRAERYCICPEGADGNPCQRCGKPEAVAVVLPEDALAAVALALVGAADDETAVKVITEIVNVYGIFDSARTEPVMILLDAIRQIGGKFTT